MKSGTVVGRVVEALRRDISIGNLKPGMKLPIEDVRNQYEVSHPSIREALSILVGEGYVSATEQRGFRVSKCSIDELVDIAHVRSEFECLALEWSIARSNTDWRSKVVATYHALNEVELELAKDRKEFLAEWDERNRDFHLSIASNCGSPALIESIAQKYDVSRRYRFMAYSVEQIENDQLSWLKGSSLEHSELKEAVIKGDVEKGKSILRKHINKSAETICRD